MCTVSPRWIHFLKQYSHYFLLKCKWYYSENKKEFQKVIKEGFYFYKTGIYNGEYDETQVSGGGKISGIKTECMKTDHAIYKDWAVKFWDNHALLEPEYDDIQLMLSKMKSFMNINMDNNEKN